MHPVQVFFFFNPAFKLHVLFLRNIILTNSWRSKWFYFKWARSRYVKVYMLHLQLHHSGTEADK